jgi:hypothetical protein
MDDPPIRNRSLSGAMGGSSIPLWCPGEEKLTKPLISFADRLLIGLFMERLPDGTY